MDTTEISLRPERPADRDRVAEITKDVWGGRDYIPRVFDRWVSDAGAAFEAAELEGVVVGVQRLRPFAPGLMWYEGLRVASTHQRRGIARTMVKAAIEESREHGFREIRLATRDEPAIALFESSGFQRVVEVRWWRAPRIEGGEPPRIPDPAEARRLWPAVEASTGFDLYRGISPDLNGARDLGPDELERLAKSGLLRAGPGGRAVAGMREFMWGRSIAASWLAGSGGSLRDLLMALRFEADADGLNHVTVNLPPGHPAADDLKASGYDSLDDERSAYVYSLKLD